MILKAQMQTVGTRQLTLVRLWPYGLLITVGGVEFCRWYRWWLQSNRNVAH